MFDTPKVTIKIETDLNYKNKSELTGDYYVRIS